MIKWNQQGLNSVKTAWQIRSTTISFSHGQLYLWSLPEQFSSTFLISKGRWISNWFKNLWYQLSPVWFTGLLVTTYIVHIIFHLLGKVAHYFSVWYHISDMVQNPWWGGARFKRSCFQQILYKQSFRKQSGYKCIFFQKG